MHIVTLIRPDLQGTPVMVMCTASLFHTPVQLFFDYADRLDDVHCKHCLWYYDREMRRKPLPPLRPLYNVGQ